MTPRFSVVIPALNEAKRLPATLAAARAAFGDAAEYLVVDGGSSDDTCAIATRSGARVIVADRGRGNQLDHGLREASGEICVFVHADTLLPGDARRALTRAFEDPRSVGGAFSLEFTELPGAGRLLHGLQYAINLRSRLLRQATGDQAMFAKTAVLRSIGGVPREPLFEDVRLCRGLRHAGRFVILPERVATSARLWQNAGEARGILLHLALRLLHALGAPPRLLARCYPAPR